MNTYKKEKIELIKRNNLFLQMEGCKSVENNFKNINAYKNSKTYSNYYIRANLKINNDTKENEEIEDFIPEKNDKNNLIDIKDNEYISNKETSNKNNNSNNVEILNNEENERIIKSPEDKEFFEENNKILKEDDTKKYFIENVSSIDNEISLNKNDSLNNQKSSEKIYNNKDKKNDNINSNNFSPVYIKKAINTNKNQIITSIIHEPNTVKSNKIEILKQKIMKRKEEKDKNIEINSQNVLFQKIIRDNKDNKYIHNKNKANIKTKLNNYFTNIEGEKNNITSYNNDLRFQLFNKNLKNNNRFDYIKNNRTDSRLTYLGFKRYQNISLFTQNKTQFKNETNIDINESNKENLTNNINIKPQINDILKKNKRIENIFSTTIKSNINDKSKKHYNNILTQLSKTIEKLPKNDIFEIDQININNTFRKITNQKKYEISPIKKIKKRKFTLLDNLNLTKSNEAINDKNKKLIFESRMSDMNNSINKLLKITPQCNINTRITFPANIFRKNHSISKIYNSRRVNNIRNKIL